MLTGDSDDSACLLACPLPGPSLLTPPSPGLPPSGRPLFPWLAPTLPAPPTAPTRDLLPLPSWRCPSARTDSRLGDLSAALSLPPRRASSGPAHRAPVLRAPPDLLPPPPSVHLLLSGDPAGPRNGQVQFLKQNLRVSLTHLDGLCSPAKHQPTSAQPRSAPGLGPASPFLCSAPALAPLPPSFQSAFMEHSWLGCRPGSMGLCSPQAPSCPG